MHCFYFDDCKQILYCASVRDFHCNKASPRCALSPGLRENIDCSTLAVTNIVKVRVTLRGALKAGMTFISIVFTGGVGRVEVRQVKTQCLQRPGVRILHLAIQWWPDSDVISTRQRTTPCRFKREALQGKQSLDAKNYQKKRAYLLTKKQVHQEELQSIGKQRTRRRDACVHASC